MNEEKLLYTVPEAAKLLRVNKNKIYDLISGGYIKSLNLGRKKIPKKELLSFVDKYTGKSIDI